MLYLKNSSYDNKTLWWGILKFCDATYPCALHPFKHFHTKWYQMISLPQWYRIHLFCPEHVSQTSNLTCQAFQVPLIFFKLPPYFVRSDTQTAQLQRLRRIGYHIVHVPHCGMLCANVAENGHNFVCSIMVQITIHWMKLLRAWNGTIL
jgi:hypothetical protein